MGLFFPSLLPGNTDALVLGSYRLSFVGPRADSPCSPIVLLKRGQVHSSPKQAPALSKVKKTKPKQNTNTKQKNTNQAKIDLQPQEGKWYERKWRLLKRKENRCKPARPMKSLQKLTAAPLHGRGQGNLNPQAASPFSVKRI